MFEGAALATGVFTNGICGVEKCELWIWGFVLDFLGRDGNLVI
jgi:hypothetical protein